MARLTDLRLGVVFPHLEIEPTGEAIARYARGVAELGFDHVLVYDHVTSVDIERYPDFGERARADGASSANPYSLRDPFHELFVLMGFLAAVCDLELASGVLVLPQRQTAVVAKQAAQVDLLTNGRLRLGVGIGWNRLEYRSLGRDFDSRADRMEDQVALLRSYWTQPSVSQGAGDDWADGVGITPLPVQRPIPIWMSGRVPMALDRVGRLADGWLPVGVDPSSLAGAWTTVQRAAEAAGRDPGTIGMEGRVPGAGASEARQVVPAAVAAWSALGATHVSLDTMRAGLATADEHLAALEHAVGAL